MFDKLGCATVLTLVIGFAPQNVVLTAKIDRSGPYNPLELQRIRGVAPTDGWLLAQVSPALVPLLALGRPREPGPPSTERIGQGRPELESDTLRRVGTKAANACAIDSVSYLGSFVAAFLGPLSSLWIAPVEFMGVFGRGQPCPSMQSE